LLRARQVETCTQADQESHQKVCDAFYAIEHNSEVKDNLLYLLEDAANTDPERLNLTAGVALKLEMTAVNGALGRMPNRSEENLVAFQPMCLAWYIHFILFQ
jgi:hypothetical protein